MLKSLTSMHNHTRCRGNAQTEQSIKAGELLDGKKKPLGWNFDDLFFFCFIPGLGCGKESDSLNWNTLIHRTSRI